MSYQDKLREKMCQFCLLELNTALSVALFHSTHEHSPKNITIIMLPSIVLAVFGIVGFALATPILQDKWKG
jgi:hypothetical protein